MIPLAALLIISLPQLNYTWPSKVLERKNTEVIYYPVYKGTLRDVEKEVIRVLAHRNITDINAVATVLGNIQQESCLLYTSPSPRDS